MKYSKVGKTVHRQEKQRERRPQRSRVSPPHLPSLYFCFSASLLPLLHFIFCRQHGNRVLRLLSALSHLAFPMETPPQRKSPAFSAARIPKSSTREDLRVFRKAKSIPLHYILLLLWGSVYLQETDFPPLGAVTEFQSRTLPS